VWTTLVGERSGSKYDEYRRALNGAQAMWLVEERLHIEYAPDGHVLLFEPYEEPAE